MIDQRFLDVLMPMHVVLSATGHIVHAGGTAQKLFRDKNLVGTRFLEVFELRRPRVVTDITGLRDLLGERLHMRCRDSRKTILKGIAVPFGAPEENQLLVNLSFGITIGESVQEFGLNSGDFAPTDLTIEMLYLVEAKGLMDMQAKDYKERLMHQALEAEERAATDTLTGLKNRRALDHYLSSILKEGKPFSLMHLDLDFFKAVNDTLGHAAGDHVLLQVAEILTEETRDDDIVARVGGDEFVLLFKGLTREERLVDIATRLISRLEVPMPFNDDLCKISGSIGIAVSDRYAHPSMATMMHDADVALYASKRKGRACYTIHTDEVAKEHADFDAASVIDARAERGGPTLAAE